MKLELKPDGYERLEAGIQSVEDAAWDSAIASSDAVMKSKFHKITAETRKLRQILREVLILNPKAEAGGPEAA